MKRGAALLLSLLVLATAAGCGGDSDETAPPDLDPFYGVVSTDAPTASDIARMARGGIGTYRLIIPWAAVESVKGSYDWQSIDTVVGELARNGIQALPSVVGTPAVYEPKQTDPPTDDPETFDAWADLLKAAADRYGPGGEFWSEFAGSDPGVPALPFQTWEIWNEPNTALFWTPAPDPDAYAALIKRSARVLRGVDPEARIMVGGMFATPQSDGAIVSYDFIKALYAHRNVADSIDAVGVHPYGPDVASVVDQLDGTRKAIDDAGDDASLWVTEFGWSSDPKGPSQQAKSPTQQATLLSRSLAKMQAKRDEWKLDGAIWFTWHDSTGPVGECQWCQFSGLVDTDRDTKPAWIAYTKATGGTP